MASLPKKEFYFHVYFQEDLKGDKKTTQTVIKPNTGYPFFGESRIMDVPLYDTLERKNLIARARGVADQSQSSKELLPEWHFSFDIVFATPNELAGSTLQVVGSASDKTIKRQWSIVGGTGVLTMAQGVIYGQQKSMEDESQNWFELNIHGYYTPMKPDMPEAS